MWRQAVRQSLGGQTHCTDPGAVKKPLRLFTSDKEAFLWVFFSDTSNQPLNKSRHSVNVST